MTTESQVRLFNLAVFLLAGAHCTVQCSVKVSSGNYLQCKVLQELESDEEPHLTQDEEPHLTPEDDLVMTILVTSSKLSSKYTMLSGAFRKVYFIKSDKSH